MADGHRRYRSESGFPFVALTDLYVGVVASGVFYDPKLF